jgi:hypothetical protein
MREICSDASNARVVPKVISRPVVHGLGAETPTQLMIFLITGDEHLDGGIRRGTVRLPVQTATISILHHRRDRNLQPGGRIPVSLRLVQPAAASGLKGPNPSRGRKVSDNLSWGQPYLQLRLRLQ